MKKMYLIQFALAATLVTSSQAQGLKYRPGQLNNAKGNLSSYVVDESDEPSVFKNPVLSVQGLVIRREDGDPQPTTFQDRERGELSSFIQSSLTLGNVLQLNAGGLYSNAFFSGATEDRVDLNLEIRLMNVIGDSRDEPSLGLSAAWNRTANGPNLGISDIPHAYKRYDEDFVISGESKKAMIEAAVEAGGIIGLRAGVGYYDGKGSYNMLSEVFIPGVLMTHYDTQGLALESELRIKAGNVDIRAIAQIVDNAVDETEVLPGGNLLVTKDSRGLFATRLAFGKGVQLFVTYAQTFSVLSKNDTPNMLTKGMSVDGKEYLRFKDSFDAAGAAGFTVNFGRPKKKERPKF